MKYRVIASIFVVLILFALYALLSESSGDEGYQPDFSSESL